jgi:hypothetical protein
MKKDALSYSAPNEINSTLARLFLGQIKNASRTFPSETLRDSLGQKTISRYCPFNSSRITVFIVSVHERKRHSAVQ